MGFLKLEFWVIFLNVTGICVWGITILYLIIKKAKKGHYDLNARSRKTKTFDDEIFTQLVKQQSDQAFKRIFDTLAIERQRLWALIEKGDLKKAKKLLMKPNSICGQKKISNKTKMMQHRRISAKDKYAEIASLANLSVSAKEISRKMKIPKGEIDLILKLRRNASKINQNSRTRRAHALS